ncbi:hypothetical protein WR25_07196 [Diploscapter pachys]|uniref:Annexin n=1 Tax=Diploscapter pachys TaxID=2018661 RepID=A0A2A2KFW4_9BILA|nr:hypothetical protein WR25_07196 [Diploscapter pachys]
MPPVNLTQIFGHPSSNHKGSRYAQSRGGHSGMTQTEEIPVHGTIHFNPSFDEVAVAEAIERSLRNKEKLRAVQLLVSGNNAQRQMIRTPYKTRFGKDLEDDMKKALSGDLEEFVVALLQTQSKYDAVELHRAMKGLGTNEKNLIELLATRTNEELEAAKNTFYMNYKKTLEDAIGGDTSGDFKKLLTVMLQCKRDETSNVEFYRVSQDAENLLKSLDKNSGVDKIEAWRLLAMANGPHLQRVFADMQNVTGKPVDKIIEKEFSGDARSLLNALVTIAQSKPKYFANQIHLATKGMGTNDKDLIRILVSRSETDLAAIAEEYRRANGKTLQQLITDECKGEYRDALLAIVKGNRM